jgi:hypothetical protein
VPAQAITAQFLGTFKEFPQRQELPSFNLDAVLAKLREGNPVANKRHTRKAPNKRLHDNT